MKRRRARRSMTALLIGSGVILVLASIGIIAFLYWARGVIEQGDTQGVRDR